MQPLGGASTSQGTPAITRADGPGGDGQATTSSAHASIISTAHGVTSKLDRIIEAALQSEEHHSASGAPPDPGSETQELIALHEALCATAVDELRHLDPSGAATAEFGSMMQRLLTPEMFEHRLSFEGFIREWIQCMSTPQLIPAVDFADCCIEYVSRIPVAQLTSALLATVPSAIVARVNAHRAQSSTEMISSHNIFAPFDLFILLVYGS